MLRVLSRLGDGGLVEIKTDESALGVGLCHENGREADTAADVGHLGAAGEFCRNTVQGGNPGLHDIVDVTWTKERPSRTEQTSGRVTPAYAGSIAEGSLDL